MDKKEGAKKVIQVHRERKKEKKCEILRLLEEREVKVQERERNL